MKQKRLLVDMDGVLADVYQQFAKFEMEKTGMVKTEEQINGKTEQEAYPHIREYVNTPGFFLNAPLVQDSVEIMEKLNQYYDIFIVSAATEFPLSLHEKYLWLQKYFPFITWQQIVLCGSKQVVKGDIMIDDHFKNLDYFTGQTILFSQPHNINADSGKHYRVHNWKEIAELLLDDKLS